MTLKKLSESLGLSVATVSKVFSGAKDVGEDTRARVFDAARRYGCYEKYYKGPRERRVIGILIPESESEYYGRQLGMLEKEIDKRGADTVVGITRFDKEREARIFSEMAYRMKVDGVIVIGSGSKILNPDGLPLVICSKPSAEQKTNADYIASDLEDSIFELVGLIKEYGHKNIGYIGETLTKQKLACLKRAMRHHGLPIREKLFVTPEGARFAAAGELGMQRLIESGGLPTVIVAAYDQIAYGAMNRAVKCGYRVPEDISFVGFDDISVTEYLDVPLTSIRTDIEQVCGQIIDIIFKRIDNRFYRERREMMIPTSICLRESLARITAEKCN